MRLRCFVVLLIAAGCATGEMKSPGTGGDDAPPPMQDGPAATHDAAGGDAAPTVDTPPPPPPPPDAPAAVDAAMPDAPPQFFCTQNSQCTNAGECCITLGGPMGVCGKGMVILGQCVPG
jgi:hypothetical protein